MAIVHIDFISDFICPWSYIGKARLERVQEILMPNIQLEIAIKPYILYPFIPKGGLPKADFAKKTKPGMGKSLRSEAEIEGIQLNYRDIDRIPNSLEAHRLLWLVVVYSSSIRIYVFLPPRQLPTQALQFNLAQLRCKAQIIDTILNA